MVSSPVEDELPAGPLYTRVLSTDVRRLSPDLPQVGEGGTGLVTVSFQPGGFSEFSELGLTLGWVSPWS